LITWLIPAYNEKKTLPKTINKIKKYCDTKRIKHEIIVVDDGSTDNTAQIAETNNCKVCKHTHNKGKGEAIKTGITKAKGKVIIIYDADGSSDIHKVADWLNEEYDIIITNRYAERKTQTPLNRRIASYLFYLTRKTLLGLKYRDTQNGLKLIKTSIAKKLFKQTTQKGYCWDIQLLLLAKKNNLRIKEKPVIYTHRKESKVKILKTGITMFKELLEVRKWHHNGK